MYKNTIYFHIAAIGKYQEIFDEIYYQIINSKLIDNVDSVNLCVVGENNLYFKPNEKIKINENPSVEEGEFFTLNLIKSFSESVDENH